VWGDYAKANTYSSTEIENKAQAIREFVSTVRPATLIDLGCNSGDFSIASLEAGAGRVVGFDFDHQAVEEAFARSFREKLNFLPLWLDAANPSPDQGWNQAERLGFGKRAQADAVIALAFEHHLIIGKNIPMAETVAWLVSLAPSGIIEFIPKSDATIQQMLALRDDIFPDYSEENFANILRSHANIVRTKIVSASGRTLYCFQK
jgi:ribosomal protein L11 methylase PrmA